MESSIFYSVERKSSEKTTEEEKKKEWDLWIWLLLGNLSHQNVFRLQIPDRFNSLVVIPYFEIKFWLVIFLLIPRNFKMLIGNVHFCADKLLPDFTFENFNVWTESVFCDNQSESHRILITKYVFSILCITTKFICNIICFLSLFFSCIFNNYINYNGYFLSIFNSNCLFNSFFSLSSACSFPPCSAALSWRTCWDLSLLVLISDLHLPWTPMVPTLAFSETMCLLHRDGRANPPKLDRLGSARSFPRF